MTAGPTKRDFLPNFFVLGAAKSGSTTLYAHLDLMPDICMSRPKEPQFFDAEYSRGIRFYQQKYFSHWQEEPIVGEAQHRNLYLPFVPRRIHAFNPDARLLVILRNPVERAHSHWYHNASRGREPLDFEQAISADLERVQASRFHDDDEEARRWVRWLEEDRAREHVGWPRYRTYLDSGYYCEQIERYLALFPATQLKVVLFEEMVADPRAVVEEVVRYLGLDPVRNQFTQTIWRNPATPNGRLPNSMRVRSNWFARKTLRLLGMKHKIWEVPPPAEKVYSSRPAIEAKARVWLESHYEEHNRRLAELLGRDLSIWRRTASTGRSDDVVGAALALACSGAMV